MSCGLFYRRLCYTVNNIQSLIYTQMYNSFIDSENKEVGGLPQNQNQNFTRPVASQMDKTSHSVKVSCFSSALHKCAQMSVLTGFNHTAFPETLHLSAIGNLKSAV